MSNLVLIKNGTVVTSEGVSKSDVLIEDSKILEVGPSIEREDAQNIDATGMYVFPGFIDAHTHYHLVSRGTVTADSFPQGSRLATFGGVTTVVDFADHQKGMNLTDSLNIRLDEMKDGMNIDYTLHQGVYGHGFTADIEKQLEELKKQGVKTLKIFTTYRETGYLLEEREKIKSLFRYAKKLGMLVTAHCEYNPDIEKISKNWKGDFLPHAHADLRPAEAEGKAIEFYGTCALEEDCPFYVVHCSSEAGLNAIRDLRRKGATVYAETTPTYLFLDRRLLEGKDGPLYVMTPPLRTEKDCSALRQAVLNGEIQVVATDHCSFTREQKLSSSDVRSIYPGIPGTEELFHLLFTMWSQNPVVGLEKIVSVVTENPAKLFGIYPQKGSLKEGSDADVVIYDPTEKWTLTDECVHTAALYTPYRGFEVQGHVKMTFLRGRLMMEDGKYYGEGNKGLFLKQHD